MLKRMVALTHSRMTVDEYLTWAEAHPGRYELYKGEVFPKGAECVGQVEIKGAIYVVFSAAVRQCKKPCEMLADGMTVRIDETTAYEPDALIYSGPRLPQSAVEVRNPVVVVEIVSAFTRQFDASIKLAGYFRLPSVAHYLIVDAGEPSILHYSRGADREIRTRVVTEGVIRLDPPGLQIALADIYGA